MVRVSSIEIDLSLQRHIRVAGHDTENGRIENLIATVLATERAATVRPREHIIVHLGQTVIAFRADMTLKMRADAIVVPQPEVRLGMTKMSALVVTIGHPTEMREIILTSLVEITTKLTGSRCS